MAKLLQLIAQAKLAPDADLAFLSQLEQMIIERYKSSDATTNVAGDIPSGGMGLEPGMEEPIPVAPVEALSRGPAQSSDLGGATAELERILAGS